VFETLTNPALPWKNGFMILRRCLPSWGTGLPDSFEDVTSIILHQVVKKSVYRLQWRASAVPAMPP
jgi:hypothetical protein